MLPNILINWGKLLTNHTFYMGCKNIRGNTKNVLEKLVTIKNQTTDTF